MRASSVVRRRSSAKAVNDRVREQEEQIPRVARNDKVVKEEQVLRSAQDDKLRNWALVAKRTLCITNGEIARYH
ncbi:MAG TPA: hypothetical protein VHR84_06830 [Terriglobales bacterium]|nr:hypothetical protein [Terriglobales bacterium]